MKTGKVEVAEIAAALEQMADPDRKEWARENYPTAMRVIGVKVPDLRPLVKERKRQFRGSTPEQVIGLAKGLVKTNTFECRQVAYELVAGHKGALGSLNAKNLMILGKGIDNWGSVDGFAALLAGPAWRAGQVSDGLIVEWARSKDHWWRRAAVVCTVALNQKARGGTGDPIRTIAVCALVVDDRHVMVHKALSWALRELAKRDVAPVEGFLKEHEGALAARVMREVRRKIDTGRK